MRTVRNQLLNHQGRHSSAERELQNLLISYAAHTGQDIEDLNDAIDKNKFYKIGEIV